MGTPDGGASVLVGEVLAGKYRVERVLGAGGMGVVLAARHVELDEVFAIKLMRPTDDEGSTAAERFLREAKACARLRGEHVAKVHDVGKLEDGTPYMVMEHLVGVDLRKLVKQNGPLPVGDAIDYVLQVCEAIAEAHAMGIVHRDLKPANLFLIQRVNGTACIKVLDFGISKQLGPGQGLEVTSTSDMLGSPYYMAPEQMRSGRSADPRSDIWSLGVVLYELAGGALPFVGNSITEVCARVLQDRPSSLVPRVPGVSPAFDRVVLRCLEKEPENRYQTAVELAAALRSLRGIDSPAIGPAQAGLLPPATHDAAVDVGPSASWGTTAAPFRRSWSRLRIGVVAVACTAAGALGAVGLVAVRGDSEAAPASSSGAGPAGSSFASAPASDGPLAASALASAASLPGDLDGGAGASPAASTGGASATSPGRPPPVRTRQGPSGAGPKPPRVVDYGDRP
jgi:hypothetical protein